MATKQASVQIELPKDLRNEEFPLAARVVFYEDDGDEWAELQVLNDFAINEDVLYYARVDGLNHARNVLLGLSLSDFFAV